MSDQSARQFMWVYDRFGGENQKVFEFRPSVLYALSAPSTPESVLEKAIEKAESGEKVTVSEVKTWKAEYEEEKRHIYRLVDAAEYSVTLAAVLCARLGADALYRQRRLNCVIHTVRFSQPSLFWFGLPVDYQPPTP